jgi:hypothetical protein
MYSSSNVRRKVKEMYLLTYFTQCLKFSFKNIMQMGRLQISNEDCFYVL